MCEVIQCRGSKCAFSSLLTCLYGLLFAAPVYADVLFQSISDLTVAPQKSVCSSCSGNFQVYDNFSLAASATITEIDFAVYSPAFSQPPITVGIYGLTGGLPGTLIVSETFSGYPVSPTGHLTDIVDALPNDWSLAAGSYDITFYNPSQLTVAGYAETGRAFYQSGLGLSAGYPTGFELIGSTIAAPEPASVAVFGLALIGLAAARRPRTAHARSSRRPAVRG